MPLYEFEEGTSRKFYRIELDGRRVHLHWGRIGTEGMRQTMELASEREAKAEYDQQIWRRRERGYRLVINEEVPHDVVGARNQRLAKTAPLSDNPRFFFVKKKTKTFTWVEARGDTLVTAEGTIGKEAEAEPRIEPCGSLAAAVRKRDLAVAKLLSSGYALSNFGVAEPKPKRAVPKVLSTNRELEAHVRADPYAEDRWTVLEDWALEQDDARAELVRVQKDGQAGDIAEAHGRCFPLLYGPKADALSSRITNPDWRAGFIRECGFITNARGGGALFKAFVTTPAARLIRSLQLSVELEDFRSHLLVLAGAPFAPTLRSLEIDFGGWAAPPSWPDLDGDLFAPLTSLESLAVRRSAPRLLRTPAVARLRRLEYEPRSRNGLDELFAAGSFPSLRALTLHTWALESEAAELDGEGSTPLAPLAALFAAEAAPSLEELELLSSTGAIANAALGMLVTSKLRPRLRKLALGWTTVDPAVLRPEYGTAFGHLESLKLPDDPTNRP